MFYDAVTHAHANTCKALAAGDYGQKKVPQEAALRMWRAAEFDGILQLPTGKLDQTGTPSAEMATLLQDLCAGRTRGVPGSACIPLAGVHYG